MQRKYNRENSFVEPPKIKSRKRLTADEAMG
jgi:hypothetical protein